MSVLYDVACPKCGVAARMPCRSLTTDRITDTHMARIDANTARPAAPSDPRSL